MTLKVKIKKSLSLNTLLPNIARDFTSSKNRRILVNEVRDHIRSGKSPVAGKRFKQYSTQYSKVKGRRKPVDMWVTGDMLKSLTTKASKTSYNLLFDNSVVAEYHNTLGAGRSKVIRRLLPTNNGERFAKGLQNVINRSIRNAVRIAVNKANR